MTRVLQNFDANLKDSRGMVLGSPTTSQTREPASDLNSVHNLNLSCYRKISKCFCINFCR